MKTIPGIAIALGLIVLAHAAAAEERTSAGAAGRQQYIAMARMLFVQPNASAPAALISDEEIAALGGTADGRGSDRVIVSLPQAAVEVVRRHPGVKYLQRAVLGPQPGMTAAASSAAAQRGRLAPAATALREETNQWSSGVYVYDGAGNVMHIGSTHTYTYDPLSRLTEARLGAKVESYEYDAFGNLKKRTTNGTEWPVGVDPASNRLSGIGYDTAGNVTINGTVSYGYDPFSLMREKYGGGGTEELYLYTAGDERIGVREGERWVWSLRDESGQILRQYDSLVHEPRTAWRWIEDYVYREGQLTGAERVAEEGGRRHFHLDHLGTPRLISGANGLKISEHEYYPFGNEVTGWQQSAAGFDREEPKRFTAHERDFAGGTTLENTNYFDYMHARYYNPNLGRFLSVDRVGGKLRNPQSWNRYSYALNTPLNRVDPDGNCSVPAGLQQGQVGICIESFIARSGPGGDNRTFAMNNPSATSRMEQHYVVNPATGSVASQQTIAGSTLGRQGTVNIQHASYRRGDTLHMWVRGSGMNAWSWAWPVAPRDPILWNLHLQVRGNSVSLGAGSLASRYPSLGIYYYTVDVEGQTVSNTLYTQEEVAIRELGILSSVRMWGGNWWERPTDFDLLNTFNGRTIIDGHPQ